MPQCRACNAEILFIKTPKGKFIPCNPGLVDYANAKPGALLCSKDGDVVKVDASNHQNKTGYVSHFATCPKADEFRRNK